MQELKQLLSDQPCVNFNAFKLLLEKIVRDVWGNSVVLQGAYPKEDVDKTPIITYQFEKRLAEINKNGVRELKPRIRYQGKTDDGRSFTVMGQWFQYDITFDIWGDGTEEADRTVYEFTQVMLQYTGFLKKMGVSEFFFIEQIPNENTAQWRTDLVNRRVKYYMRLDETVLVLLNDIQRIDIDAYIYNCITGLPSEEPYKTITIDSSDDL